MVLMVVVQKKQVTAAELLVHNLEKVKDVANQMNELDAVYTAGRLDGLLDALGLKKAVSA